MYFFVDRVRMIPKLFVAIPAVEIIRKQMLFVVVFQYLINISFTLNYSIFASRRNILSDVKTVPAEKKRREKPSHTVVDVVERMDTKEVVYKDGNGDKRLKLHIHDNTAILFTQSVQNTFRFVLSL